MTGQMQSVVLTDFMSTDEDDPESRGLVHQQQPWQSPVVSGLSTQIIALFIRNAAGQALLHS